MARFQDSSTKNKEGYNRIHDSITHAKTIAELTKAIEASLPIIQECKLDDYQTEKLEQYGMTKYNKLMVEMRRLQSFASNNKIKK